jgi:ABC-type phosphate transport system ATPase subunit
MGLRIKAKEATAIINSLSGGVVPRIGVQHITVGRKLEIEAFTSALDDVKNGHSMVKFWIGDFGSGKSFMLHLLNTVATKQKFVVANADFTPENRLYSNDGKAVALYSTIMDNVAIQTKPEGGALPTLLDKWIEQVVTQTAFREISCKR